VPKDPATFGRYLELLMAEHGFQTKAELARASGVDATTIGRWVAGEKEPAIAGLRAIAPHLGVRLGDLMIRAGLASAAELGTVGAPPAPRAPLPPAVQRVMSRLLSPRYTERQKSALLAGIDRTTDSWEDVVSVPKEPQMRRRLPDAKR
jgi:transcriptional regulator with XRE-family HTH domain